MTESIYAIYATDASRHYLLGYAIGEIKDIEEFYDNRKAYGLEIKRVEPIRITGEIGRKLRMLREQKICAENELKRVSTELKNLGVTE